MDLFNTVVQLTVIGSKGDHTVDLDVDVRYTFEPGCDGHIGPEGQEEPDVGPSANIHSVEIVKEMKNADGSKREIRFDISELIGDTGLEVIEKEIVDEQISYADPD